MKVFCNAFESNLKYIDNKMKLSSISL